MKNLVASFLGRPFIAIPVAALLVGGVTWVISSRMGGLPEYQYVPVTRGSVSGTITLSGTVAPAEEIDLAFQRGGTVAGVNVRTGQTVAKGQLLASLSNQDALGVVNQAKGAYEAALANLEKVKNGAAAADLAVSEASLSAANQTLANLYASLPDALSSAYAKGSDATRVQLAPIFSNAETAFPALSFQTSASQAAIDAVALRASASAELNAWQKELALSSETDTQDALKKGTAHLGIVHALLEKMGVVLDGSVDLSNTTLATYRLNLSTAISETNAAIASLNTLSQTIAAQKAAVGLAEAQLVQKQSPARGEDVAAAGAQADAALGTYQAAQGGYRNTVIIAPTNGTVTFVNIKAGESATPNQTVIGMVSGGAFELVTYVDEEYVARLPLGAVAELSLDELPGKIWKARVVETESGSVVAQAHTQYKVKFEIVGADASVRSGMRGTIMLKGEEKKDVLVIPRPALFTSQGEHMVLVRKEGKLVQTKVTVGLVGSEDAEVVSGLAEGDTVAVIAH